MAYKCGSTTLDDAFTALHTAVGLPETSTGKKQIQFFLRIAVILAWISVEEMVKQDLKDWAQLGFTGNFPRKLTDQICLSSAIRKYLKSFLNNLKKQNAPIVRYRILQNDTLIREALSKTNEIELYFNSETNKIDKSEFILQRDLRNNITHTNSNNTIQIDEAKSCLKYCVALIEMSGGHAIVNTTTLLPH